MYCRECGNQIPDSALRCPDCGTKAGEGVSYCQNCGNITSLKTEFCFHCGAKQKNIMTQKMKTERINSLQKQVKFIKRIKSISKFVMIGSILIIALLFAVLVLRKEPENIPEPFAIGYSEGTLSSAYSVKVPSDYMYYANEEVQEYWMQGRQIFGYIFLFVFVTICSFFSWLIQKIKYKKLLKALKEAKNVL